MNDDNGNQVRFDVKADLLKELGRDQNGTPFVDLFVSTHPHDDHCKGFEGNFYHGAPEEYNNKTNKLFKKDLKLGYASKWTFFQQSRPQFCAVLSTQNSPKM